VGHFRLQEFSNLLSSWAHQPRSTLARRFGQSGIHDLDESTVAGIEPHFCRIAEAGALLSQSMRGLSQRGIDSTGQ
jgi:hypothetical protein